MEINNYELEPNPRVVNLENIGDDVYLTIEIGNGQIGGSKITLDGEIIAKGNISRPTYIGNSSELKGKTLVVETNILDTNPYTNTCVFITTFYNQEYSELFSKIDRGDASEGGIASFIGKYGFSTFLVFVLMFLTNFNLSGQNSLNEISFKELQTPSSPGFMLLDKTPESIEKPTTPQGFGASVLGFFRGTGGAIDFAPFWLKNHPNLSAEELYGAKVPILYNLSISGATIKSDSSNFIAGGIRTRLFQSYGNMNVQKLDSIKHELENALAILDINAIKKLKKEYSELIENPIFTIDFASAIGAGSNTNSYNDLELSRWAIWLSFNYRPNGGNFYFTALTRYINNEKFETYRVDADLVDLGIRFNYDIERFNVSLEYLQRLNFTNQKYDDNRIALIGSYRLSENFYLTSTFGKNFSNVNNIIALAGISFGFAKNEVKAF